MPDASGNSARGTGWFSATVGSGFGAIGMQSLLFSWLIVGELRASPEWVGIAQAASALPQLALLMAGGAVADRVEPRRMLAAMHVMAAIPPLALAAVVLTGSLSIASVIGYGVAFGAINAFLMPPRDTLLSRVAGANMVRAVTAMTMVQFSSQIVGTLVAGTTEWVGSVPILTMQAVILVAGAFFALRLPQPEKTFDRPGSGPAATPNRTGGWFQATAGLREVWHNPALFAMLLLVSSVGVLFIGPFLVVFPILVRDFYQGGAQDLSLVLTLFPVGAIAGSLALRAQGAIRLKVRATMLALLVASVLLGMIGAAPTWPLYLLLTLCWGLTGSVFINLSRSVFQEQASTENRARVLAVYQLGVMGGAPIGSLLSGFASESIGPHTTLFLASGVMFAIVATIWLGTGSAAIE
ncbi:MAG: MFS transporter [Myxococcota bacterium]